MDQQEKAKRTEKRRALGYAIGFFSYLLILLPAALAWLYVRAFGVSVVFADAWSIVPLFNRWSSGKLHLLELFSQHNEHRMLFPKGVELLLGTVTKYDNMAEMYLIQLCLLLTLVILFLAFRVDIKSSRWLFLFVPVSLLVFSFRQYENMLFGFQINFAFVEAFGVLALFLLYVARRRRFRESAFVGALGSATIASFSGAQGLLVWPAGLLQLFLSPVERPAKRVVIAVWGLIGVGEWVAYFVDYARPENSPSLLYALEHPLEGIKYFLDLLGSSLFWEQSFAFVGGSLLACLALVSLLLIYKDGRLGGHSFWLSLLLYSLLILASITLGRAASSSEPALTPRYTAFSILAVVSVYAMLVKAVFERRSIINTVSLVALSGLVLLSAAISYPKGIEAGSQWKVLKEKEAFILSTYESQPDEALESLHPISRVVRKGAPVLQELGYNVFSERQAPKLPPSPSSLSPVASSTPYAVAVTGPGISQQGRSLIVPKESPFIKVVGWAVDSENESTAGGVYVDIDGKLFPAFYGTDRQDVAEPLGVSSYRYSGFERFIPISEIGTGAHELSVVVLTADGERYYQPDRKIALETR